MEDAVADDGLSQGDGSCGGLVPTTIVDMHCATLDGGRGDSVAPHEGSEADDDNCLYHAKVTVPCIQRDQDVTVTFDLRNIGTTTPATGADPQIDGSLGNHPTPNTNPQTTEANGIYTIGPVRFDRAGRWILTFHVYDPLPIMHSHVSFFVDVP
jgi:hypothetical protein